MHDGNDGRLSGVGLFVGDSVDVVGLMVGATEGETEGDFVGDGVGEFVTQPLSAMNNCNS